MPFVLRIVRHDNKDIRNFVTLNTLPSELILEATWRRNDIKEVHFYTGVIAGVAHSAAELIKHMKHPGFGQKPENIFTFPIKKRAEA